MELTVVQEINYYHVTHVVADGREMFCKAREAGLLNKNLRQELLNCRR
jgi:hypothetical protein